MSEEISIAKLKDMQYEILDLEQTIENMKVAKAEMQAKLDAAEGAFMDALKKNDLKSFKSEYGTFSIMNRYTYKVPKTVADKKLFGKFLADIGNDVFWEKISFPHMTVQGVCKDVMEKAKETGDLDAAIPPGIGEPSVEETLSIRKK